MNERLRRETEARLSYFADHPEEIGRRLLELEREWDVDRTLGVNGAILSLSGLILGALGRRAWFLLPVTAVTYGLLHALEGRGQPMPMFRRFGFRTQREIDEERYALKALRGDFDGLPSRASIQNGGAGTRLVLDRMRD